MEKMQKNADYYEKSADCAAGIGKNMRYDTKKAGCRMF